MADGLVTPGGSNDPAFDIDQRDALLIDVDGYEGPLHLLLGLARRQKVDLLRVSILNLAEQYLDFIKSAQVKRMDLAADYLLMAAWLAYLKSRLLLPKNEAEEKGEADAEDMAARLAFRLQRLEAMRQAAADLIECDLLGRDVFPRGLPEKPVVVKKAQYSTRLIDVMAAFAKIQQRKTKERPHSVVKQYVLPLESARKRIVNEIPKLDHWKSLSDLSIGGDEASEDKAPRKSRLASLFAASLDLTKAKQIDLRQDRYGAPVMVKRYSETTEVLDHGREV